LISINRFYKRLEKLLLRARRVMWTSAFVNWKIFCGCTKRMNRTSVRPCTKICESQSLNPSWWKCKSSKQTFILWFKIVENGLHLKRYI